MIPEQALWLALINRLLLDSQMTPTSHVRQHKRKDGKLYTHTASSKTNQDIDHARYWLGHHGPDFRMVCDLAGLNHEVLAAVSPQVLNGEVSAEQAFKMIEFAVRGAA